MNDSSRPGQADAKTYEIAYEERQRLRDLWPMLPTGIVGNELYERHKNILGTVPDYEEIWDVVDQATFLIRKGGTFNTQDAKASTYYCALRVQSFLWFAEMCGLIRCVGKDRYMTLFDEMNEMDGEEFSWPENLQKHGADLVENFMGDLTGDMPEEAYDDLRREEERKKLGAAPAVKFVTDDNTI